MAFIHRIKELKPNNLTHHCKRYYFQLTTPRFTNQTTSLQRLLLPNHHFVTNSTNFQPIYQCPEDFINFNVRFFAAPVQVKKKEEVRQPSRPRINEEIQAQYLRLVTDEGHSVVSLNEALSRAKSLELDLVEVDRDAKPPVCKMLDFHREKYKKQVREKERAKLKAAGSLRKGTCKEVRISAKTELKDLQLKADTVKRLMERGYRVKCTATGSEDQDLSGMLSQLSALIEDVAFVESGPKRESKQAHLVVRHIKFGAGKKGGKKASKDKTATTPNVVGEEFNEESDSNNDDEVEAPSWLATPVSSTDQSFDEMFNVGHEVKGATSSHDERVKFKRGTTASTEYNNAPGSSPGVPSFNNPNVRQETENRYARSATKNDSAVRNPMRSPNNGSHPQPPPPPPPQPHPHPRPSVPPLRNPMRLSNNRSHPQLPPQPHPHPRPNVPPPKGPGQSGGEGCQPPNSAGDLRSQSTNFGIFSNPSSDCPSDASRIPLRNLNPPPPKSDGPQKSESADKKFGIFSR